MHAYLYDYNFKNTNQYSVLDKLKRDYFVYGISYNKCGKA